MIENGNFDEKKNVRKKLLMTIVLVVITIAIGVGGVYAYFAASVTQDTTSGIVVSAVSGLKISFSNDANINISNALPGQSWKKTFSAILTNKKLAFTSEYAIYMKIGTNGFDSSAGELTYQLKKGGSEVKSGTISGSNTTIELYSTSITGSATEDTVTDSYELIITYPNLNTVQTQGATFNGSVYFGVANNKIDSSSTESSGEDDTENLEVAVSNLVCVLDGESRLMEDGEIEEFIPEIQILGLDEADNFFHLSGDDRDFYPKMVKFDFYIGDDFERCEVKLSFSKSFSLALLFDAYSFSRELQLLSDSSTELRFEQDNSDTLEIFLVREE